MPLDLTLNELLEKAKAQEQKYGWLYAVWSYEQALHSAAESGSFVAETWQKMGFCYERASRQVENLEEFKELRRHAVEAYQKAAKLFEEIGNADNVGRSAQCKALAEYALSWLASTPVEKAKVLDKCREFGGQAVRALQIAGDELNLGRVCNLMLSCLFERLYVAPTHEEKQIIAREAMQLSKDALAILSRLGDKGELLQAYATISLQNWYVADIVTEREEDRKQLADLSLSYSEKALAMSKETNDPYDSALSNWAAALCTLAFTENATSALEYAQEMLRQGLVANDNYLKGMASYILAYATDWTASNETDPEKRKERYQETIAHAQDAERYLARVAQDSVIGETYLFYGQSCSSLAHESTSQSEKLSLSKRAVEVGRKGLEYSIRSGSPDAIGSTLHALSKALHFYANQETGIENRAKLLEEALGYRKEYNNTVERAFPSMDWVLGVGKVYTAQLERELSSLEVDENKKRMLLERAIVDMDDGVSKCEKWITSCPTPSSTVFVAGFEDSFGKMLDESYSLTEDEKTLRKANGVYSDAAKRFKEVELTNRVAESYWKIARNLDLLGDAVEAARNYQEACSEYENAAQSMPSFTDFFLSYASYMKAWSEIEKAKFAHNSRRYAHAMKHYKKTASLLKQNEKWGYLSSNFLAWAFLEKAEALSRNEKSQRAIEVFKKAAVFFRKAKGVLDAASDQVEVADEKQLIESLIKASDPRVEYCFGRIAIEEAKVLDGQGEHVAGAEKYGSAANILEAVMNAKSQQTRRELPPIIYLCKAWQKMLMAEAKSSSGLYGEAAELFEKAKEYALDQSSSLLALAHSSFCKALEAGTEFENTRNMNVFSSARNYMAVATNYYIKSGFPTAADYASGMQRLFDAYFFMETAKDELDQEKKARYYAMAEKVLQFSAEAFTRAQHLEKIEQVQQILRKVKEEKELAGMLSEILHAPTIVSSTASFATLAPTEEKAVGLESFERAKIQTTLVPEIQQVKTGEELTMQIEMVNVGKEPILLTQISGILPASFELAAKPDFCYIEDSVVNLKGKRLDPLKTEKIVLAFRSRVGGSFELKPQIAYIDEAGHRLSSEPAPATVEVSEGFPNRTATGSTELDRLLVGGIPENYSVILTAPFSDERDMLIRRFLETGVEKDEIVFYLTIEPAELTHLAEQQSNLFLFVCNPQAEKMVKNVPNIFKLNGVERITDISIALTKALRELSDSQTRRRRVCIGIVSDVLLQHQAVTTKRWLTELISELKARRFTTMAVVNPLMHSAQDTQAILGIFEGEIALYDEKSKAGSQKFLRVKRMYNQKYLDRALLFNKEQLAASKKVSEVSPNRIATGCAELDQLLMGGIPESYTVILTSPFCDERDVLIRRFLEKGTKESGIVFCVSTDVGGMGILAEEFSSNFYLFVCNPRADLMIKDLPNVTKLKGGVMNLTDINIALNNALQKLGEPSNGSRRICIGIVSDVLLQHQAVTTKRWLTELISELRMRRFTTLGVVNPLMHSAQDVQAILGLFDGEITLYDEKSKDGSQKFLRVKRMHNQEYLDRALPLRKEDLEK